MLGIALRSVLILIINCMKMVSIVYVLVVSLKSMLISFHESADDEVAIRLLGVPLMSDDLLWIALCCDTFEVSCGEFSADSTSTELSSVLPMEPSVLQ